MNKQASSPHVCPFLSDPLFALHFFSILKSAPFDSRKKSGPVLESCLSYFFKISCPSSRTALFNISPS